MLLQDLLFPELNYKNWGYVNLDSEARYILPDSRGNNVLLDPEVQNDWINTLQQQMDTDLSWGGYLEDRSNLLRGSYIKNGYFCHVGLDFWVPENTKVHLPIDSELIHSEMDQDYDGGWGGKLIFKIKENLYLILGHLDNIVDEKRVYKIGEEVGIIGKHPTNGNFAPHLHIQCCKKLDIYVDGYHQFYEGIDQDFPNPKILESLNHE